MITFSDFSFQYSKTDSPVLRRLNLNYSPGEFSLICGPTGSGKSTFLKTINGLAPHFTGGTARGRILLAGQDVSGSLPHQLAELVGYVNQQPEGSFVADTVEDELAYGLEQLGIAPAKMHEAIVAIADSLGLADLLTKPLGYLSGGQQQRVAIGAAIAAGQRILVLDEPTSALDSEAAEELLRLLTQLAHESRITVLIAEHRIERLIGLVDSVTMVHPDGSVTKSEPAKAFNDYRMVPPLVELAQRLDWKPLPLDIEAAESFWNSSRVATNPRIPFRRDLTSTVLQVSDLGVNFGGESALHPSSFSVAECEVLAIVGKNGSGKSSLLWAIQGSGMRTSGKSLINGVDPAQLAAADRFEQVCLVPQNAADLLFLNSLAEELEESDRFAKVSAATTAGLFARLAGRLDPIRHPRDLSAGQQLALVLALQLVKGARVLLLDEPTRGLDYEAKRQLATQIATLKSSGKAVLVATHDLEFVSLVADSVLELVEGRVISHLPVAEALASGTALATQISSLVRQPGVISINDVLGVDHA